MTYWVHVEADGKPWYDAEYFIPEKPRPVPAKGFPNFYVEIDGVTFVFSSMDEIRELIRIFEIKVMPSSQKLVGLRYGTSNRSKWNPGTNRHWLSRLPAQTKSLRYRSKAVNYFKQALVEFGKEIERC